MAQKVGAAPNSNSVHALCVLISQPMCSVCVCLATPCFNPSNQAATLGDPRRPQEAKKLTSELAATLCSPDESLCATMMLGAVAVVAAAMFVQVRVARVCDAECLASLTQQAAPLRFTLEWPQLLLAQLHQNITSLAAHHGIHDIGINAAACVCYVCANLCSRSRWCGWQRRCCLQPTATCHMMHRSRCAW